MKITLYYDDCRHCSSEDYPFWNNWYSEKELIRCDSDDRSHLEYLKKDRVIEIWIESEE